MDDATLVRIREQLRNVRVPSTYDKVFKDECMYSFADAESEHGIFINMNNWQGVGARYLELDYERTGNALYYNEQHTRVPLSKEALETQEAVPTEMAIGGDHGFQVNKKKHDISKSCSVIIMPEKKEIPLPCPELPEVVLRAISGIQGNEGALRREQASSWEEERKESKYARSLEQLPPERKISPNPGDWVCDFTGVNDNLWLNLSTGKIGSGRRHWDGSGGNGTAWGNKTCANNAGKVKSQSLRTLLRRAALRHFEQTGKKYPLVVKLGTITPHSADVYSYAPDEDDMVTDPLLQQHLSHWGINMMAMEKTDKTMAEIEIDMNIKFEYNAITEGGAALKPVFGPRKVGLENLGNYCYMSCVLQALWGIPAFANTFVSPATKILRSAPEDIVNDFPAQFAKVGSVLVTGVHHNPSATHSANKCHLNMSYRNVSS